MIFPVTLRFITDDQRLIDLCNRYWEVDAEFSFKSKVSDLAREFDVPSNQLSRLVAECSAAFSSEANCSICQTPWVFTSRTEWQQRRVAKVWTCRVCLRKEAELREAERIRAEERRRETIRERYALGNPGPIDPLDLSLDDAAYLVSFTRLLAVETYSLASSLDSARRRLSPTHDLDLEILKSLYHRGLITVDANSQAEAFVGDCAERFCLSRVQWLLPFGVTSDNPKDFVSELEELLRGASWPTYWLDARLDLWKKVALNECLQYLAVALGEHGFVLNAGEKTFLVLNTLLEIYSVAQIYNMIWRAARDAAAFYLRGGVSKPHAANTVVGAMQRYGERAKAEGWEVKPYRRNFDCPQSMLSDVLFNVVLRIGDDGFNKVPSVGRLTALATPNVVPRRDESANANGV